MGIIGKFFPAKTTVTSVAIIAETERAQTEIASLQGKIADATSSIALLSDADHQVVEANVAAMRRAIARLESRIATLDTELPSIIAAEEATAKAEQDAALVKRAEAARKDNASTAKKLLASYAEHAEAIADVLAKLKAIDAERDAVNNALRSRPIAETVPSYNTTHRTVAEQPATEHRTMAPHWIFRDASPQPDEVVNPNDIETAVRATLDDNGKPIPPAGTRFGRFGQVLQPVLEMREVVHHVGGHRAVHAPSLDDVCLPPAFGGEYVWPRS